MSQLIIAPIALPAIIAAFTLLAKRQILALTRIVSLFACAALIGIAIALMMHVRNGAVLPYAVGDWPAPFGIILVLDRLSAMMLLLTSLLAFLVLVHAVLTGLDRRGWHFHPLFHFQLLGLNGAFLTGDIFNLFVFFEVLLIASYGLMLHGQGAERLTAGVQYVIVNLVGSTMFLFAVGILYGVTGTLNMADMAARIADAPPGDQGLIRAGGQILIAVFALKAALLPLHLWLPRTYAATSAPVAALFAILTKVGVYSILRVTPLIFGEDAGAAAWAPASWMLPAALLTASIGFIGLLAAGRLRMLAAFAVIGSTGTLLIPVSLFEPGAVAAALYYLPHSTLAGASLFLVTDLICRRRRDVGDALASGERFAGTERISLLFLLAAIALAGLPPLSGFIGKLLILESVQGHEAAAWIWSVILITTFIAIIGLARAGSLIFWKSAATGTAPLAPRGTGAAEILPAWGLIALLAGLTVFAGPVSDYMLATAGQVFAPDIYIRAVVGGGTGAGG